MFRAATVLRSAPRAAAAAVTPLVARRTIIAPAAAARPAVAAVAARAVPKMGMAVRWYSAGGPLNKEEVEGRIMNLLQGFDKVNDVQNIKPAAHFANDLGLDSLDTVEVVMAIEEEFSIEIPDKDADNIHSVDNAVQYILNQPDAH